MHDEQRQKFPIVRLTLWRLSITKELMERLTYDYSNLNRLKGINKFQCSRGRGKLNELSFFIMLVKLSLTFLLCFFLSWFVRSALQFCLLSS